MTYRTQIKTKEEKILSSLGFLGQIFLEPSVNSPTQGFRNRAKMSVTGTIQNPCIGLTGPERALDEGRELLDCLIHHPEINLLIKELKNFITLSKLMPYQIESEQGELKGLIIFYEPQNRQMYLRFILRSQECFSRIQSYLPNLQEKFASLICVSVNIQPIPHAVLEGPVEIFLTKQDYITLPLGEVKLRLAPQAFVQTNLTIAAKLYETAARWIQDSNALNMLELYCGQGAFSFSAARLNPGLQITGIEINQAAISNANQIASELGLTQLKFLQGDVRQLNLQTDWTCSEMILVNPPRRGLDDSVQFILNKLPKNIIYSSCSIETLALDLEKLSDHYGIKRIQLFDMFPHTDHFETLIWLVKK